jgi:NAD(P) transhydrogenase subunit alpha
VVLRVRKPPADEVEALKDGAVHISFLDPFHERELVEALANHGVTAVSLEMLPRITRAQKMDGLSSQASLAGYVAVLLAANELRQVLPMMMTPAGTIRPSRVFVIGAGVAGLQAIATAQRLGARVEAFDTRAAVKEQVESLGARFVEADLGETGEVGTGYAKELTEDQQAKQREAMAKVCAQADIVITTAKLFGREAPTIITDAMLSGMKEGAVVVDGAVESGGNVEGSELGRAVECHGVRVLGYPRLETRAAVHASQVYASNLYSLVQEYWDADHQSMPIDLGDEILQGCVIAYGGEIVNEQVKGAYGLA